MYAIFLSKQQQMQQNKHLHCVKLKDNLLFKIMFPKGEYHTKANWLTYARKHQKENQLQILEHPCSMP